MDSPTDKPKRGRPRKYPIELQQQAYKQQQVARYAIVKDDKCQKTKLQGHLYRFAFKILKDMWTDNLIPDSKYKPVIQTLIEQKQINNY
jgi:hypothetical protein